MALVLPGAQQVEVEIEDILTVCESGFACEVKFGSMAKEEA